MVAPLSVVWASITVSQRYLSAIRVPTDTPQYVGTAALLRWPMGAESVIQSHSRPTRLSREASIVLVSQVHRHSPLV